MDPVVQIVAIAAVGLLLAAVCFGIGARFIATRILTEIATQGFFNLNGVRYRVDRIGRKPKDESK